MRNTTDATPALPRMRLGVSALTLDAVPISLGECSDDARMQASLGAAAAAGFQGLQTWDPRAAQALGFITSGIARVDRPTDAVTVARANKELGHDCATLHVGTGFESDDAAWQLIDAVIDASEAEGFPMYVETHRATVTQDMKRTLDIVQRFPAIRLTLDFSHWYTGAEMLYGDFDWKLLKLSPVFERVRFVHGRISDPGCIQIPACDGTARVHVARFRRVWTESFRGFLRDASAGDYIWFCPELLPPAYFYARTVPTLSGARAEECDRWQEALHLVKLAKECWSEAMGATPRRSPAETLAS